MAPVTMRSITSPSFVLALTAALAVPSVACSSRTTGTPASPPEPVVGAPTNACGAGAIASLLGDYKLNVSDAHAVWVDAQGVLLNLAPASDASSTLAAVTTSGDFTSLYTSTAGTLLNAGATTSSVFLVSTQERAMLSVPRKGGASTDLGDVDDNFLNVALGPTAFYEATLTGISSMPTTGGAMTQIHSGGSAINLLVGPDGASLYWITGNTGGPYYVRTTSLSGAFTASTVATMPDESEVIDMAVADDQVFVLAQVFTSPAVAMTLFSVSTSGGTPAAVDTLPIASTTPVPALSAALAVSSDAVYYSLGAGLKKLTLATSAITAASSTSASIDGVGASPSATGAVYVSGQCVYSTP